MNKEEIVNIITVIAIISVILVGLAKHIITINRKYEKRDIIFSKLRETHESDLLDLLDQISYNVSNNINSFKDVNEFISYIVIQVELKFKSIIQDNIESELKDIADKLDGRMIDEFIDYIIEDNKYETIFRSIYEKALADYNKDKLTQVSKPEVKKEENNGNVDISTDIEKFYV